MTNKIEPTQADRIAAVAALREGGHLTEREILWGGWDNGPLVQAIIRHRLTSTDPLMEQMAEALDKANDWIDPSDTPEEVVAAVTLALAAYRASKGEA